MKCLEFLEIFGCLLQKESRLGRFVTCLLPPLGSYTTGMTLHLLYFCIPCHRSEFFISRSDHENVLFFLSYPRDIVDVSVAKQTKQAIETLSLVYGDR